MVVLIEKYRGFDINFDTTREKFTCLVDDENSKLSSSYSAMIKYIDDYLKNNSNFVAFWIESKPEKFYNYKKMQVIGINKSGMFIVLDDSKQSRLSKYDEADYILCNDKNIPITAEFIKLKTELDGLRESYDKKFKDLINTMEIVNLKEYKNQLIKEYK